MPVSSKGGLNKPFVCESFTRDQHPFTRDPRHLRAPLQPTLTVHPPQAAFLALLLRPPNSCYHTKLQILYQKTASRRAFPVF